MEKTLYVGIDLHKTQFTVCVLRGEDGLVVLEEQYPTTDAGYREFSEKMHEEEEKGYSIELAVETTGNARYFKNRMEAEGFGVVVVNTNKFKVITTSTKKTDANDAATLAFYLMKYSKSCARAILWLRTANSRLATVALRRQVNTTLSEPNQNGYQFMAIWASIW